MSASRPAANLLRQLREGRGDSLRAAANDLDVSPGYLSRVERGEKSPSPDLMDRMARYYDVDPEMVALGEGRVPDDILEILQKHPEVIDHLRDRYRLAEDG